MTPCTIITSAEVVSLDHRVTLRGLSRTVKKTAGSILLSAGQSKSLMIIEAKELMYNRTNCIV